MVSIIFRCFLNPAVHWYINFIGTLVHFPYLCTNFLSKIMEIQVLEDVVIKFAGDSGDGMQLTGGQFTTNTALLGS